MSRDDFDFINLTENLEKNTEELIKEVKTEAQSGKREDPPLSTDIFETAGQVQRRDTEDERNMYRQQKARTMEYNRSSMVGENGAERYVGENYKNVRIAKTSESRKNNNRKREGYGEKGEDVLKKRRGKGKKRTSKAQKKWKNNLIKLAIVLLILFAGIYALAYSVVSKTNYEKRESHYERDSDVKKVNGVKNILLIGTDARSSEEDGRSDSMIIVSINNKKNKIVMTSVLRDSYVEIPGHGHNRINAAYSYGQEELLIQTIEHNYKIPIDAYAKVDFFSFIDIVDSVGGVEIEITPEEMQWINAYLNETNELLGKEFGDGYLNQSGVVNLTGKQALSYARIRYIGTDFGRTERQRKILTAVVDKVKKNPSSVSTLMNSVLPNVTTDMKASELTVMTMQSVMYLGYDMEQFTLPADNTWKNASIKGMSVLEVDFEANIQAFKEVVYGERETNTESTIQE